MSNTVMPIHSASKIRALRDHVICEGMEFGERKTAGGIVLLNDNGKTQGIRPRWAQVLAVGPEQKDIKVGQWVLIEHGRWSRAVKIEIEGVVKMVVRADQEKILGVSDEKPADTNTFAGDHISHV